jgi:NTE family protein
VINLPKGVIRGQNLQIILRRLFVHVSQITHFDHPKISFSAVTRDVVTGQVVVFLSGCSSTAVRASMSIPGLFAPVEIYGRMLADGGISNTLAVDIVHTMGVDYVIAVDIATLLYSATERDSVIPIIEPLTTLLTFSQLGKQYGLLGLGDVLINPDLKDINTADFDKTALAISQANSANSHIEKLLRIRDLVKGIFLGTEFPNVAIAGIGVEHHQGETKTFIGPLCQTQTFSGRVDYLKF